MAKKRGPDTFISRIFTRHEGLRKIEGRRATEMSRVMKDVKKQALSLIDRNMTTFREAGEYIDSAAALSRAEQTVAGIDALMAQRADWATTNVLSMRKEAWTQGVSDIQFASQRLPGGIQAQMEGSFGQVFPEAAFSAIEHPVLGVAPNAMFNGVRAGTTQNMRDVLVNAVVSGESVQETGRRLSDAMDISVAAGQRIARTNVNAAYNEAHKAVYDANSDIIAGYAWEATLDDRTSQVCFNLHGQFWPTGSRTPGPPAHWNCRSILIPVFKDPAVQAVLDDTPRRARQYDKEGVGRNFFLKSSTTPEQWARRQPSDITLRITGSKLKHSLFRRKLIGFDDLVDPSLRVRTDEEIIRRAAGLHPGNKALAKQARAMGVKTIPSQQAIRRADASLAKKQPWTQPKAIPTAPPPAPAPAPAPPTLAEPAPVPERFRSQRAWEKSLSPKERDVFEDWIEGENVGRFRQFDTLPSDEARLAWLKKETFFDPKDFKGFLNDWKTFHKSVDRAPIYRGNVWRGISDVSNKLLKEWSVHSEIEFSATASSSASRNIAKDFALQYTRPGRKAVIFEFKTGHSATRTADLVREMSYQKEALIPANSSYRIIGRSLSKIEGTDVVTITLEAL